MGGTLQTRWYKAAAGGKGGMRWVQIGDSLYDEKALAACLAAFADEQYEAYGEEETDAALVGAARTLLLRCVSVHIYLYVYS